MYVTAKTCILNDDLWSGFLVDANGVMTKNDSVNLWFQAGELWYKLEIFAGWLVFALFLNEADRV